MYIHRFLIAFALLLAASPASAWWEYGHRTVGAIAHRNVTPETRRAIAQLIAQSRALETPTCPLRNIEDAGVWPDCVKGLKDRFSYASSWHYQSIDVCKPFDQESACKDGHCVSTQIERNARLLADRTLPARERLQALAFLVHFVGDLHMPLHAGDRGDFGGNRLRVNYGIMPTNLHSMWDGYLAERAISTPEAHAAGILSGIAPAERAAMQNGTVTDWARESWEISRTRAYATALGDPCGPTPEARPMIDEATTQALIPVVRLQIARGGLRLAGMLDAALA